MSIKMKIVVSLILVFFVIFFVLSIVNVVNTFTRSRDSNFVCNPSKLFDLWVRDRLSPSRCPDYTNNLVVLDDYKLYEKEASYEEENNCCFFNKNLLNYVEKPFVCIGNLEGKSFTVQELNTKPYKYTGSGIQFTNPVCKPEDMCVELVYDESINRYINNGVIPPLPGVKKFNSRLSFKLGDDCQTLYGVYLDGNEMTYRTNEGVILKTEFIFGETEPALSSEIRELFNEGGRFYPIAGDTLIKVL